MDDNSLVIQSESGRDSPEPNHCPPTHPRPASGPAWTGLAARTVLAGLVGALALLVGGAAPASAHAAVVATAPEKNALLGLAPAEVTVTFSEPVRPVTGRVQVLAPDGRRINDGEPSMHGAVLRIPIRTANRPLGTYLVSYRVISADSHPIGGAFTYAVGAPSASAPRLPDHEVHPSVRASIPIARYLGYTGLALLTGPALFLALLWPRRLPRTVGIRLARAGIVAIAVGTLGMFWLQAPFSSAAAAHHVSPLELWQVLNSQLGVVLLARLGLLALAAALLPPVLAGRAGRRRAALLVPIGLAGAATWPLAGHPVAAPVPSASVLADTVHVAAMAVWLGGLVILLTVLLPRAHPRALGIILPVWSRWATIAVIWLVGGGLVQALVEVGSIDALVGSAYGRLVLGKSALLGVALAAAAYARRTVLARAGATVPSGRTDGRPDPTGHDNGGDNKGGGNAPAGGVATAVRTAGAAVAERWDGPARRRLRGLVRVEIIATAVVLGLTAILAHTTPGRQAGIEAADARLDAFAQTLESRLYTLQVNIYPVQLGESNTVHAFAYTPQGQPVTVEEWTVTTSLPGKNVEPVSTLMLGVEANQGVGALHFPIPGQWAVRFTLRLSDIDQATVTTTVTVA